MNTMIRRVICGLIVVAGAPLSLPAVAQETTIPSCDLQVPPKQCKGVWALTVKAVAPNGAYVHVPNPGCMNDSASELKKLIQAAVIAAQPQLAAFSGPLSAVIALPLNEHMKGQGGDLGKLLSPYAKNGAMCLPLVAIVPTDATVRGFRLMATDAHNRGIMRGCKAGADCNIGWSKFQTAPHESGHSQLRTYSSIFMNWSHDRSRTAEMIIFYSLPNGKVPLTEL